MKTGFLFACLICIGAACSAQQTHIFMPNTTSPQHPGVIYYPALQKGYELNHFNRPPQTNVITGTDHHSTRLTRGGQLDTTPVDDTGTEKDIHHKLRPNWIVPSQDVPVSQTFYSNP
jgi:hypothetical protein